MEIPVKINIEKATAGYQDGFLVIVLPKVTLGHGEAG